MKKFLMVAMALIVAMLSANAAPPSNSDANVWKYAKKQAKQYEKEGWKIDGLLTMEESFYYMRKKLLNDPENNFQLTGRTDDMTGKLKIATTITGAKDHAQLAASSLYAQQASLMLRGAIESEVGGGLGEAMDNFYSAYEGLLQKHIANILKAEFGLSRENKTNNVMDYIAFYIINEEKASKARVQAMEEAVEVSEVAREHADKISKFVREKFQPSAQ